MIVLHSPLAMTRLICCSIEFATSLSTQSTRFSSALIERPASTANSPHLRNVGQALQHFLYAILLQRAHTLLNPLPAYFIHGCRNLDQALDWVAGDQKLVKGIPGRLCAISNLEEDCHIYFNNQYVTKNPPGASHSPNRSTRPSQSRGNAILRVITRFVCPELI